MEGPIARYQDTAHQLTGGKPVTEQQLFDGVTRILWGMFKKIVIADRLSLIVTELYRNYAAYNGIMIPAAAVTYTMQLYMEFSGVMDIVIGSAGMFGIALPENFRQPFFSQSASEFWRRWHISLGVWLKTYLFYPVTTSGMTKKWNRFAGKKFGKYITKIGTSFLALTPVWLFNGLWHGASWHYIFYGVYYLVLLMIEVILEPAKKSFYKKTGFKKNGRFWTVFRIQRLWDGTLLKMGLDQADWLVILAGIAVVFAADLLKEKNFDIKASLAKKSLPVRWAAFYGLIFAVLIFGAYGPGYQPVDLIYAGF